MHSAIYRYTVYVHTKRALCKSILDAFKGLDFEIYNYGELDFYISRIFRDVFPDFCSPSLFDFCSDRVATVCIERIPFGFEFSIRVEY